MYSPAQSVTAPLSLIGVALIPFIAVLWLVMAAVAVVMLVAMLVIDAGAFLARGGRPNPARSTQRRTALIPSLF